MGELILLKQIKEHLKNVDGVMIGRSIYHSPYFLADIERDIFFNTNILSREEIINLITKYCLSEFSKGVQINQIMRHTVGLFHGVKGANNWKRYLSENLLVRNADINKVNYMQETFARLICLIKFKN